MGTATDTMIEVKEGDVFWFSFNEVYRKKHSYTDHCWDGQLVAKFSEARGMYFIDTYWASKHDGFTHYQDVKNISIEDALKNGELSFLCNLNDVEEINERDLMYYSDEDVFNLSYQHRCYKYFVKKKGAARSQDKMIETLKAKIADAEYQIKRGQDNVKWYGDKLTEVEAGNIEIYI